MSIELREFREGNPVVIEERRFLCPAPNLIGKEQPGKSVKVTYPVSIYYNGGTVVDGKWYSGYMVPDPIVPKGFKLVDMGIGLELNAHPPRCTMALQPIKSLPYS